MIVRSPVIILDASVQISAGAESVVLHSAAPNLTLSITGCIQGRTYPFNININIFISP